jgi:hypothetical protein
VLTQGTSFEVGLKHSFQIPTSPTFLTFDYSNLSFDTSSTGRAKDAFEAAFVDSNGNSLVPTIAPGRDAFFNITEGMPAALATGVTLQNGTVNLDISHLFATTTGTIIFRLITNDADTGTTVRISANKPPAVTVSLLHDTAPTGPNTDQYRSDLLTTDPTITGTASATAGINWGNGTTTTGTLSESGGAGTVAVSHVYAEEHIFGGMR